MSSSPQQPLFVRASLDDLGPEDRMEPSMEDSIRAVVGPSEVTWHNGVMLLTATGMRLLCQAVQDGRLSGNPDAAAALLERMSTI